MKRLELWQLMALLAAALPPMAACGGDSTRPLPAQNPTVATTATPSGTTMYAGDSLVLALDATDSTAVRKIPLAYTYVAVQGALAYSDSVSANGAYHVARTVRLRIPDGPLASGTLTWTIGVVPTEGASIVSNSFIITVLDTVSARRIGGGNAGTHH